MTTNQFKSDMIFLKIAVLPVSDARLQWSTIPTAFRLWDASRLLKLVRNQSYLEPGITPTVVMLAHATMQWSEVARTSLTHTASHWEKR